MTMEELLSTVEEFHLPMDGTYMNVIRFGRSPKVLAILSGVSLCGLEGAGPGVAGAYTDFAEDYTIYLFDRKKVLPIGYTVEDMAEDVYRALDAFGVKQADVYGVSQGGMMALCLAAKHPALVHALAMCSTQARAGKTMRETAQIWQRMAEQHDTAALNRDFIARVYSDAYRMQFSEAFRTMEQTGNASDCERFAVLARACETFDIYNQLTAIHCPALVLADVNDRVIDHESSLEIAAALGCECYLYQSFSHAVFDETPDAKQRVLAFMRQASMSTGI